MKLLSAISLFLLLLSSCVSKKKYASLQEQHNQTISDKAGLEEVLSRMAIANDSLRRQNEYLDSLLTVERERPLTSNTKKDTRSTTKPIEKSTLSKAAEYDKKAVYLYNFAAYISWPKLKTDKFTIGIVGESMMNSTLAGYTYGKTIGNMPVVVKPYTNSSEVYQVLFISAAGQKEFHKLKKEFANKPVLLVTENIYLEKTGAHISFYVNGAKVGFSVNKAAAEKSGLKISNKLINFSEAN
ncbi:MAG: YfiR family protein [Bacteroidia bacterium]